jgi:uncharacterized protein YdeI (BOF family)
LRSTIWILFLLVPIWLAGNAVQAESICWIQAYDPSTGFSPLYGQTVTVTGVITVPTGIFQQDFTSIYIRGLGGDDCGINVFSYERVQGISLGDTVTVTGEVEEYVSTSGYGAITEITFESQSAINIKAGDALPEPALMSTGEAAREESEGKLVRVKARLVTPVLGREFVINDGTGEIEVYDFGENFIQDSTWLSLEYGDEATVTGIVSQSDPDQPYLSTYTILPRSPHPPYQDVTVRECVPSGRTEALLRVSKSIFCPESGEKVTITYDGPHNGRLRLRVFDVYGRSVATLDDRVSLCGESEIIWDGRNELMEMLPAGLYHLMVTATDSRSEDTQEMAPVVIGRRLK